MEGTYGLGGKSARVSILFLVEHCAGECLDVLSITYAETLVVLRLLSSATALRLSKAIRSRWKRMIRLLRAL